jgi:hypothetical protein
MGAAVLVDVYGGYKEPVYEAAMDSEGTLYDSSLVLGRIPIETGH